MRTYLNAGLKKAPEGLVMLKANGENTINWTNVLASHCEMKYVTIAGFIRDNKYPVRDVLTVENIEARFPGTSNAVATKMLVENMTNVMKQEAKDKEHKFEMCAILESVVTEEGWNRVKSRSGFADAQTSKCPLEMIKLVKMEHSLKMNNVSDKEARYIAEDRYNKVVMGPTRSLAEYYEVFNMCVDNMTTLECEGMQSEERMARHFLMRLDRARYGGYMRDAINDDRNNAKALPTTRQAVVDAARMHIPNQYLKSQGSERSTSIPMVYNMDAQKARFPCHKCKQLGHWARECPENDDLNEKADVETTADAKSTTGTSADAATNNTWRPMTKKDTLTRMTISLDSDTMQRHLLHPIG